MNKIILIFFGPPGSGKGTQVELLLQKTNWHELSIGSLLRHEIEKASKVGKLANKYIKDGKLVPDEVIKKILEKFLKKEVGTKNLVLDGYPRDQQQQSDLIKMLLKSIKSGTQIYAIEISLSDKEVKERLCGRYACYCGEVFHLKYNPPKKPGICDNCGKKLFIRTDDKPKIIATRLKIYHKEIGLLLDYWRKAGKLIKINGEQSINKVFKDLVSQLKKNKLL
ncbi:MAG: nucleoside monophosphate kinase [Patescibacteria group bacterium]